MNNKMIFVLLLVGVSNVTWSADQSGITGNGDTSVAPFGSERGNVPSHYSRDTQNNTSSDSNGYTYYPCGK